VRVQYADSSLRSMMRAGFLPPLKLGVVYNDSLSQTYTPLARNNYETGINSTGAHQTRGGVNNPDSLLIAQQTETAWRKARVSAQAGLGMYFHVRDHRAGSTLADTTNALIPFPFYNVSSGDKTYEGTTMGAPVVATRGVYEASTGITRLVQSAPVGGTGTFLGYDSAHHPDPCYPMAFLEGERYLAEAQFSAANWQLHYNNWNGASCRRAHMYRPFNTERTAAQSIPSTFFGAAPDWSQQERAAAWAMRAWHFAFNLAPDAELHRPYIKNMCKNLSDFIEATIPYYPADHIANGGCNPLPYTGGSTHWQTSFSVITGLLAARTFNEFGWTGYQTWAELGWRRIANWLTYSRAGLGSYQESRCTNAGFLNFYPPDEMMINIDDDSNVGCVSSVIQVRGYGPWFVPTNGDPIEFPKTQPGATGTGIGLASAFGNKPPELSFAPARYYVVNATKAGTGPWDYDFQVSATEGGEPISLTNTTKLCFSIACAAGDIATPLAPNMSPNVDSFWAIHHAAMETAIAWADPGLLPSSQDIADSRTFFSGIQFAGGNYAAWNMDAGNGV
jgi:hypothetical protein